MDKLGGIALIVMLILSPYFIVYVAVYCEYERKRK